MDKRVVLILGDPDHGKTHLGNALEAHGFHVVRLDPVYVRFVESRYAGLHLERLSKQILGHYHLVMQMSGYPHFEGDWSDYVAAETESALGEHRLVAVEGYLLFPALASVLGRITGRAEITTVLAYHLNYFVIGSPMNIEQIRADRAGG